MPRGDKSKYSAKQQRQAEHIEEGYEQRGVPEDEAEARAWATVNKQSGGGERPGGSGRKKSPAAKRAARQDSAKRAVATKQGHSPNRGSARSTASRSARTGALDDLTKAELLQRAAVRGIVGRSRMRKQELLEALR